jgi:hypothetical protein
MLFQVLEGSLGLLAETSELPACLDAVRSWHHGRSHSPYVDGARLSELEARVAQLEKNVAAAPVPVREPKPTKPARVGRQGPEINPDEAVPPGVAVRR